MARQICVAAHDAYDGHAVGKRGLKVGDELAREVVILLDDDDAGHAVGGRGGAFEVCADMEGDEADLVFTQIDAERGREPMGKVDRHVVDGCEVAHGLVHERVGIAHVVEHALIEHLCEHG